MADPLPRAGDVFVSVFLGRRGVDPDLLPYHKADAPLLGLFGNDDQSPSPAQVDQPEQALQQHGKTYFFHRYDDAGHGFFHHDRPQYRVQQAMDGWGKVFDFFGQYLA